MTVSSLETEPVRSTLERLHEQARGDRLRFLGLIPRLASGFVQGKSFSEAISPSAMKDCFIPISPEQGRFLYLTARAIEAKNIVEFGTSFGISTLYLAAAVRDNGQGLVVGSEIEPNKHAGAVANLAQAGLAEFTDVRLGDALETLRDTPESIDLVLLDGWKDLYLPVLELLKPRLARRAVVLADNIYTFRKAMRPYVDYVQSERNGFVSTTLSLGEGFEYSVYVG